MSRGITYTRLLPPGVARTPCNRYRPEECETITSTTASQRLQLNPGRIAGFLLSIAIVLTLLHIVAMFGWYRDLLPVDEWLYLSFFDLDEEEALGTWFSTMILLAAGLLTLFQARYPGGDSRSRSGRWHGAWWLLGLGFCMLSLDEVAGFHEFVNTVVEDTHWTTFGILLVLAAGLAMLPFLVRLPPKTRWLFLLAGGIYVGGAVGVEAGTIWHQENDQLDTLGYNLWNALEEFMEMAGIILYIYALLAYIAERRSTAVLVCFGPASSRRG